MNKVHFGVKEDVYVVGIMGNVPDQFVIAQAKNTKSAHALKSTLEMLAGNESLTQPALDATFTLYQPTLVRHRPAVLITKLVEESRTVWGENK